MRKKTLPLTSEELRQRQVQLIDSLATESDRGCVLVAAAVLEEALEQLLRAQMPADQGKQRLLQSLFSNQGAFATFASKTKTLYMLGYLSSEVFHDLEAIREIRNAFAHQYQPATFMSPEIQVLVGNLKSADRFTDFLAASPSRVAMAKYAIQNATMRPVTIPPTVERARFALSVGWIAAGVDAAAGYYRASRAAGDRRPPCVV